MKLKKLFKNQILNLIVGTILVLMTPLLLNTSTRLQNYLKNLERFFHTNYTTPVLLNIIISFLLILILSIAIILSKNNKIKKLNSEISNLNQQISKLNDYQINRASHFKGYPGKTNHRNLDDL